MQPVIARSGRCAGCRVADEFGQDGAGPDAQARNAARANRRARQARVGILRNPKCKPLPAPRRPPLIGRHVSLRSSRRPPTADPAPEGAGPNDLTTDTALVLESDGQIARIDIDRLAAIADRLADWRPRRAAFAAPIVERDASSAEDCPAPSPASPIAEAESPALPGSPDPAEVDAVPAGLWQRLMARLRRAARPETG